MWAYWDNQFNPCFHCIEGPELSLQVQSFLGFYEHKVKLGNQQKNCPKC